MKLPERRTRLVAATPIDLGERRLLPSVLVEATSYTASENGLFRQVKMRPVSIVVEGSESAQWLEIPNETTAALSSMVAAAAGIAFGALALMGVIRFLRRN
ncbi:MAG: hypothetical protein JXC32_13625 [Anaerolineae bacterium]|nr:hypothetical protein [Anaerolineae bacterium]